MAQIESIVQPNCIADDVWRESVTLIGIHSGIVSQAQLIWQYLAVDCFNYQWRPKLRIRQGQVFQAPTALMWQRAQENCDRQAAELPSLRNPEFAKYATLCGAKGERVTVPEDIGPAFERVLAHPGPALLELITDAELI